MTERIDSPTDDPVEDLDAEPGAANHTPEWARALVLGLAVLALLAIGMAGGMALRVVGDEDHSYPRADSVDVGFCQDMSVHHYQAIDMASWFRDHASGGAADPVRTLAFDIESSQTEQVGRMQGYLALWGQAKQATGKFMTWMKLPKGHTNHSPAVEADASAVPPGGLGVMPGMASSAELARYRSLSGRELEINFLQLMLRHHEGGIPMLRFGAERASEGAVRNLAGQAMTAQIREIAYMRQLLAERHAAPLPG